MIEPTELYLSYLDRAGRGLHLVSPSQKLIHQENLKLIGNQPVVLPLTVRQPDAFVNFNYVPDRFCRSCRGGINGMGDHCREVVTWPGRKEKGDYRCGMILRRLSTEDPKLKIHTSLGPYGIPLNEIRYRTLFDRGFGEEFARSMWLPCP